MAEKELTGPLPSLATANALASTLDVLAGLGRIDPIDAARVALVKGLAAAVDCDPLNASLWKQYREALADLLETEATDGTDSLYAALRDTSDAEQTDT
jgi:hypothetical protein